MAQEETPGVLGCNEGLGRLMPERKALAVRLDPVADALDDMAALGQHWTRNRERGRMPNGIRAAMLMVAREVLALNDAAERDLAKQMSDLCGPDAFARTHGAFEFTTAAQKGLIAGDGKACPNDHDPDCRFPQCNCRQWGQ